jgi:hypothetical protein
MIVVRFTSGLGNQMFQYSLYSMLKKRYREIDVKADLTWFYANSEHQGYELSRIFEHNEFFELEEAGTLDIFRVTGLIPCFIRGKGAKKLEKILYYPNRLLRLISEKHFKEYRIVQTGFEDNKDIWNRIDQIDPKKNWYITGFFIEEVYYMDRLDELRVELQFPNISDNNRSLLDAIRNTNSVSIHVRRGDYLDEKYNSSFKSLSMEYYKDAVEYIREKVEEPVFFIFSDDKEFIEKEFYWLESKRIVNQNIGKQSYIDMQLMSECKHNIIANSTFSVWGALLNRNKDRLVIYPQIYMKEKDSEVKNMEGWIRL